MMQALHTAIRAEADDGNSLVVLARGLGMHHAITSLLSQSITSTSLIIGMNISRPIANTVIYPTLASQTHPPNPLFLPRFLSADYSVRDRTEVYKAPGFIILTSAVMVHDLLHAVLPANRVSHVLIFAADRIRERSNHHFALNLFRAKNRTARITAFSDSPTYLARGFHTSDKLLRRLYLTRLSLWPRFHHTIRRILSRHTPDLVDLTVPLTSSTTSLLASLRLTITSILHDLHRIFPALDLVSLHTASSPRHLLPNFDDAVRHQLDLSDTRPSARSRALLADLSALRALLADVLDLNPIRFYQRIVTLRVAAARGANWLVRKDAQRAIFAARSRVWRLRQAELENVTEGASMGSRRGVRTIACLEAPPKWRALRAVLREIQEDVGTAGAEADVGRVLVLVKEENMVNELAGVLADGDSLFLEAQFQHVFPSVADRARRDASGASATCRQITMTQLALPEEKRRPERDRGSDVTDAQRSRFVRKGVTPKVATGWNVDSAREELKRVFGEVCSKKSTQIEVIVRCMEWVDLQGRGHLVLDEYRPAFVVLYNADLALVRQVEVYKASQPGRPVRMYILSYDDAVEEQRFRQAGSREKAAFKTLIRERATMTVQDDQEGCEPEMEFTQNVLQEVGLYSGSRRGLGVDRDSRLSVAKSRDVDAVTEGKVLVDTRELRSSLPMLLHQSSLTIVPLTLEVGDFILSNNIGIERKSIPDLHGSFASGRLFKQAEALCRHYEHACLLIELDASKPVSLTATSGGVPAELTSTSIVSKIVLLLQQFPNFRLLWARGPHDAAELFAKLKANEGEPDVQKAASLGVDTKESREMDFNAGPKALLRSLPGIDSHNLYTVMKKVRNVSSLITMSKEEMIEALGSVGKATKLYDFVNEEPSEALAAL